MVMDEGAVVVDVRERVGSVCVGVMVWGCLWHEREKL